MTLTREQREQRRTCIGGSDWASILGIEGAYGTPLDVWQSKVEPIEDETQTYAQARGDALEPFVAHWFGRETGHRIDFRDPAGSPLPSEALPSWWRCQIDAVVIEDDGTIISLEAKTSTVRKRGEWGESGTDQVPLRYVVQVMAQIAHLDTPYGYLAVDIGGDEFRWYRINRDDELIAAMRAKGEAFWKLVTDGTPPPPTTSAEANIVWRTHEPGEYLDVTPDVRAHLETIARCKAEAKRLDDQREAAELALKSAIQEREGVRDGMRVLCTWKTQSSERIDTKAFRAAQPQLAARFLKTSTTRVLRVKDID